MSDFLRAVILGMVQGLTEFIPVSSSGHLVLLPYLTGWERPGLAFDVALHFGTLFAVVAYFWRELAAMAMGLLGRDRSPTGLVYRRLGLLIVLASVPVGLVGLALEDFFEETFATPVVVPAFLLVTAALLTAAERYRDLRVARGAEVARSPGEAIGTEEPATGAATTGSTVATGVRAVSLPTGADPSDPAAVDLRGLGVRHAVVIGLLQACALFPGVSRSGSTIAAGVFSGLTREAATRFSFLLSLPALVGAGVLSLGDLSEPGMYSRGAVLAGVLAAFLSGYLAIRFLVKLVARDRLTGFALYCVALSLVGFVGYLLIGPPAG